MSAIVLLPGKGNWFFDCGWGENSKQPLQGESIARRSLFAISAPAGSLVGKLSECKFHLQEDKLKGGAASCDPNSLLWKIEAAL